VERRTEPGQEQNRSHGDAHHAELHDLEAHRPAALVAQEIAGLLVRSALRQFPHVLSLCFDLSAPVEASRKSIDR
jgi:hypothetical protein